MPLDHLNLGVAPMEGLTVFPTRLWLHLTARPASMTTPFLRVTRTHPEGQLPVGFAPELFELRGTLPYAVTPQLLAASPEHFLRAAELLPPDVSEAIELNCGCPSPNGAGAHAGSGILAAPAVFGATLERLSTTLGPGRLAVKMRVGIADSAEIHDLLPHVVSLPLARLTVHGRTRAAGYRGRARWDLIEASAAQAKASTWASGDVTGLATLAALRAAAPSAGNAMIGRGVLRNPWIFEELRTGQPVRLGIATFANALLCYALLHELWLTAPGKLVARIGSGRIGAFCGTDAAAWERLTATLTGMVSGVPFTLTGRGDLPPLGVSPTAAGRLRVLWSYVRTSLPAALASPRLARARSPAEFFALLFVTASDGVDDQGELTLCHQAEWDRF